MVVQLAASQEGLFSVEVISYEIIITTEYVTGKHTAVISSACA
jgi:hypothetical protein